MTQFSHISIFRETHLHDYKCVRVYVCVCVCVRVCVCVCVCVYVCMWEGGMKIENKTQHRSEKISLTFESVIFFKNLK